MVFKDVRKIVSNIKLITGLEHFPSEEEIVNAKVDALAEFASSPANRDDLVSIGINTEDYSYICNLKNPIKDRWLRFEPYFEQIRNTSSTKTFEIATHDIYGVDELNAESFVKLNERMRQIRKKGFYEFVLRDMAKIDYVLNDTHPHYHKMGFGWTWSNSYVLPLIMLADFVFIQNRGDLENISRWTGVKINSLHDLLNGITEYLKRRESQIFGIKFTTAYNRTLKFGCPSFEDAEKSFKEVMKIAPHPPDDQIVGHDIYIKELLTNDIKNSGSQSNEARPLQDYVMNHILSLAGKYSLPVLFHTGILGGYGKHFLDNANPVHLSELFIRHKQVKFVNLHTSFPYSEEACTLAKMFPNVYIDMTGSWVYVGPTANKLALSKWMDQIPINKVMAFGADESRVEITYAVSVMARETIAQVLWEKVDSGELSQDRVPFIAQRLLRDNAYKVYLSNKKKRKF